jgi:hypothetical protein
VRIYDRVAMVDVELRRNQERISEVVEKTAREGGRILINEPPGSGKTLGVIYGLAKAGVKALALVPNRPIIAVWERYEVYTDDGEAYRFVGIRSKREFQCPAFEGLPAWSLHVTCNLEEPVASKMEKCRYYAPPFPGWMSGLRVLKYGEYMSIRGERWSVPTREAVCPYYDQFKAYADGENLVMTYDKFFLEALSGRLPRFDVIVMDEVDVAWQHMFKKLELRTEFLREVMRMLKEKGQEGSDALINVLADAVIALEQGVVPSNLSELATALRMAARRLDMDLGSLGFFDPRNAKVIAKTKGKAVFLLDNSRLSDFAKSLIYITGTPMEEDEVKELFRSERYSYNKRQLGKIVLLNGGDMAVKGIWFKQPKLYKGEVQSFCRRMDEWTKKLSAAVPTLVPIFSYRHFMACEDVGTPIELFREYMDKDGSLLQKFAGGEVPVVFSSRAIRGIHFDFSRMAIAITKYPFPDVEDDLIRWMLSIRRLGRMVNIAARSALYQAIGRGFSREENLVYLYSPDKKVYDELGNMARLFEMDITKGELEAQVR